MRFTVVVAFLFLLSVPTPAQQAGQITGRVTDSSGAIIAGADVSVTNISTGVQRKTVSNAEGIYSVPALPPGQYKAIVQMQGFRQAVREEIILSVDQVQRIDFTLDVGNVTEQVEVSATAGLLDTATTAVSTVIPNQKILDLPLNYRNPMALANLIPGVRALSSFGSLPVSSWNTGAASIGGGPPVGNSYMIDGVANEVSFSGAALVTLSADATEEFRIVTHNPSAEYGRSGGGVINFVSKSGTNEFHGTAYEFMRNKVLNANDFFANKVGRSKAAFVFNQFGATLGGPVVRNRTFFFFNWESFRQRTPSPSFFTVPTELQKRGDFSQTFAADGKLIQIYDPSTTRLNPSVSNQWIRDLFPGNVIPSSRINSVAAAVTKYYPAPNLPGNALTGANNYYAVGPSATDKNILGIKLDHHFTPEKRLSGRYTYDNTPWGFPNWYGNIADNDASDRTLKRQSAVLGFTDVMRPDLLFEAKTGFNYYRNSTITRSYGFDLTSLGFPANVKDGMQPIFPAFTPGDVSVIGARQNDHIVEPDYVWTGSLSFTKFQGSHSIKSGFESRVYRHNANANATTLQFSSGRSFTQGPTDTTTSATAGYGFASFLLGTSSGSAGRSHPVTTQFRYWAAFVQDDWKVTPRLTLNLGLRWDVDEGMTDRYNAITNFDPNLQTQIGGLTLKGGAIFPGVKGVPRSMRDTSWTDFQPRAGFAFEILPRTSLRGGFGIMFLPGSGLFTYPAWSGFSVTTSMIGSYNHLPYDTLSNPFPGGIERISGSSLGGLTALGSGMTAVARNMRRGYVEDWNLNVQREFGKTWLVELGYMGTHGVKLPAMRALRYLTAANRALGPALLDYLPNPYYGIVQTGSLSLATVTRSNLITQYPHLTGVSVLDTWGNSNYHAFTTRVEKRFSAGTSMLLAYTWSKLIDDAVGSGTNTGFGFGSDSFQDWDNLRRERAVSTSNLPHRLVVTNSWELPVGRSGPAVYRRILGGWQVNSILTLQSGNPISISAPAPSFGGGRPNVVGDPNLSNPTIDKWFNTAAFALIPAYTMGNSPRNLPCTRTDSLFNWDVSFLKNAALTERVRLQFRGEFFNFLNHPTAGMPGTTVASATFGIVSATASTPRQVQLALKAIF